VQTVSLPQALQRAFAAHQAGNLEEARHWCDAILSASPDNVDAIHLSGIVASRQRRLDEARRLLSRAVELVPQSAEVLSNYANVLKELRSFDDALAVYDRALAINPAFAAAHNNRGVTLKELGRYAEALESYDKAIAIRSAFPEALSNRGVALLELGRYADALASFEGALGATPGHVEAMYGRAFVLHRLRRHGEALAAYDALLRLAPNHLLALSNRAAVLQDLGDFYAALASCERALALDSRHVAALCNRGAALQKLRRFDEALASFDRALAIKPQSLEALTNRGITLRSLERHEHALATFNHVLAIDPDYVEALDNRGATLAYFERHAEAAKDFERVLALDPGRAFIAGSLVYSRMHCCDWRAFDELAATMIDDVRAGKPCTAPFAFLAVSDSAADQLACARTWVRSRCPAAATKLWNGERYGHDRLRIAYLSADFHDHPVAYLTAGLFERHDRRRFETIGISFGPHAPGPMRSRIEAAFERFVDVREQGDAEVAALLRRLEVDVAVDLTGFTLDARTGILARRPAPVQVNYLGFPATMGAEYIDYIVADRHVIPEELRSAYGENVIYLPDTFQANDPKRRISDRMPSRLDEGLPQSGFVFCSFSNNYKIHPSMFDVWMRLLTRVAGSVLWLAAGNASVAQNLRREAAARGIDPDRLVFAPRIAYADHLARCRLADLFLDTLPFNGGTTASDALWAGLPVLTCPGQAFAARMASSLLHAVGLPELIASSLDEYETRAVELAQDEALLAALRRKLSVDPRTLPLFDADGFRSNIEAAYLRMHSSALGA